MPKFIYEASLVSNFSNCLIIILQSPSLRVPEGWNEINSLKFNGISLRKQLSLFVAYYSFSAPVKGFKYSHGSSNVNF